MNAKDAIKTALTSTKDMLSWYLSDLSDKDLLVRPVPSANHIAWQLGHLISSEARMTSVIPGTTYPELPAGFAEQHSKDMAATEPPKGFRTKEEYLGLFNKVREATLANLAKMPEATLDQPTPGDMKKYAPTLGALLMLTANHTMMHAGQFTVVRRKLGKPILF
jgi:uncharacterized damage-inducible protein DinB